MDEIREVYAAAGSDHEGVLARYGGNEELLWHLLCLFGQDPSIEELRTAIAEGKRKEAFLAAHTMKGICANLGFTGLYERASALTELLRRSGTDEAGPLFSALEEEYLRIAEALRRSRAARSSENRG